MSNFVRDRRIWTHEGMKKVWQPNFPLILLMAVAILILFAILVVPLLAAASPLIQP